MFSIKQIKQVFSFYPFAQLTVFVLTTFSFDNGAFALPSGGQVVAGSGQISQGGNTMNINQNSQNMVINWQTFNINNGQTLNFNQPNSAAIAVNRVTTQNASQILGNLNANGQVFVINPNGVLFGKNAQVNVGGLVATTLNMSDQDAMAGHYNFTGNGAASVENDGHINTSSGGYVALLGASITNNGTIQSLSGNVSMAAASDVTLQLNNGSLTGLTVNHGTLNAIVQNHGLVQANNGQVYLTAKAAQNLTKAIVNNDGEIDANSIDTKGGTIRLVADGGAGTETVDSGKISAKGMSGGTVELLSNHNVGIGVGGDGSIVNNAVDIDVSGINGGGVIRVGGGEHGDESGIEDASHVFISKETTLNANATDNGNGGSVVVWGNNANNFLGNITANGGEYGGDGGFVETSAHNGLTILGSVNASAKKGKAGTWLVDPTGINIVAGGTDAFTNPFMDFAGSTINPIDIDNALVSNTNVQLWTTEDITVSSAITASGAGSLYLEAHGSIYDNAQISSDGTNNLNVYLWADFGNEFPGTTYVPGQTVCPSCVVNFGSGGGINTDGGSVDIETNGGGVDFGSDEINAGAGSVDINTGSGAIRQGGNGAIIARILSGSTTGSLSLLGKNVINFLSSFSSNGFSLLDTTSLTVTGPVGGTASNTSIQTIGNESNITFNQGAQINGKIINVAVGGSLFTNNAGIGVFNVASSLFNSKSGLFNSQRGSWNVWLQRPNANNNFGGLTPNFTQYNARYGSTTPSGTGNGLLYASSNGTGSSGMGPKVKSVLWQIAQVVNAPVTSRIGTYFPGLPKTLVRVPSSITGKSKVEPPKAAVVSTVENKAVKIQSIIQSVLCSML